MDHIVAARIRSALVLVVLTAAIAAVALRLGTGRSEAAVSSTLHATVGPDYTISLTFDDGEPVTAMPAGSYRVLVTDRAVDHNFHLTGPGLDELTAVETTGSTTWNVTFRNGVTYDFQCDPHADAMSGRFVVGAAAPSSSSSSSSSSSTGGGTPSSSTSSTKAKGTLLGTVTARLDASGKLGLTLDGKPITKLRAGSYRLTVVDRSSKDGVTLRRIGGQARPLTPSPFTGSKTITMELTPGRWQVASSRSGSTGTLGFQVTKA
jgi:hypothetical protein